MGRQVRERKGIVQFAASYSIFGFRSFWLGVVIGSIRERRLLELGYGAYCYLHEPFFRQIMPGAQTDTSEYRALHLMFYPAEGRPLRAREQSVIIHGDSLIAGEYGAPGARIYVRDPGGEAVHEPYADDAGVYHIHSIRMIGASRYLVSTGDTRKYLDEFYITQSECRVLRRWRVVLGGYTALRHIHGNLWAGSDFAERPNHLVNLDTREKIYLPKQARKEYVLDIQQASRDRARVFTKKLGSARGHVFLFDTKNRNFVAGNGISVHEVCENGDAYAARPAELRGPK